MAGGGGGDLGGWGREVQRKGLSTPIPSRGRAGVMEFSFGPTLQFVEIVLSFAKGCQWGCSFVSSPMIPHV